MGKEAKKSRKITWEYTIEDYLRKIILKKNLKKEKITVVTTYPIYPPRGGGQNRIFIYIKKLQKHDCRYCLFST